MKSVLFLPNIIQYLHLFLNLATLNNMFYIHVNPLVLVGTFYSFSELLIILHMYFLLITLFSHYTVLLSTMIKTVFCFLNLIASIT